MLVVVLLWPLDVVGDSKVGKSVVCLGESTAGGRRADIGSPTLPTIKYTVTRKKHFIFCSLNYRVHCNERPLVKSEITPKI